MQIRTIILSLMAFAAVAPSYSRQAAIPTSPATPKYCYSDTPYPSKEVFWKTEVRAKYTGQSGLAHFLNTKIPFLNLAPVSPGHFYSDTALVKFILSSDRVMSDLSVGKTNNESFSKILQQVIKESACHWVPGITSGRELPTLVRVLVFYSIEGNPKNVNAGYEILK